MHQITTPKGLYRHHKGHVYYVHGVSADPHDGFARKVVYTSVKTECVGEPGQPAYDFLHRDEGVFNEWIHGGTGATWSPDPDEPAEPQFERAAKRGYVRRFARITDPSDSVLPPLRTVLSR